MNAGAVRLAILAFLLSLSFGTGYFVKSQFVLANEAKQSRVVIKDSAKAVVQSVKESARIETAVAVSDTNAAEIKAAVKKHGITLTPTRPLENCHVQIAADSNHKSPEGPLADYRDYAGDSFILDNGTVGLLNAAREGRPLESSSGFDEKKSAPSTVGVDGLVYNDLEIVRMYHDLAKRHDELVDAVQKKLEDQAR